MYSLEAFESEKGRLLEVVNIDGLTLTVESADGLLNGTYSVLSGGTDADLIINNDFCEVISVKESLLIDNTSLTIR